jgi:hypothetical protein
VAVAGDTVVAGAYDEDSNAIGVNGNQSDDSLPGSGAAYIFTALGAPRPQLAIEQSAPNLRVFWPLPADGFVLEAVNTLNVTGWTQVPFPYQTNATHISITVPMPIGSKFFRLREP